MKLSVSENNTVWPYFKETLLYQRYQGVWEFEPNRVHVIVGPNGSGKSTLLEILAKRTLCDAVGHSYAHKDYLEDDLWAGKDNNLWGVWSEESFLPGVQWDESVLRGRSFKPHRIPGNERCVTTAMMMGYFEQAKAYAEKTEKKSTGQSVAAQLEVFFEQLKAQKEVPVSLDNKEAFELHNWDREIVEKHYSKACASTRKVLLSKQFKAASEHQLWLIDEPEQSLDLLSTIEWFDALAAFKPKNTTVIVATHSPLALNRGFIEIQAQEGYLKTVQEALNRALVLRKDA